MIYALDPIYIDIMIYGQKYIDIYDSYTLRTYTLVCYATNSLIPEDAHVGKYRDLVMKSVQKGIGGFLVMPVSCKTMVVSTWKIQQQCFPKVCTGASLRSKICAQLDAYNATAKPDISHSGAHQACKV